MFHIIIRTGTLNRVILDQKDNNNFMINKIL